MGNGGNDVICGSPGADRITGVGGNDVIFGFAGDDQLVGGLGADVLLGGPSDDRLTALDAAGGIWPTAVRISSEISAPPTWRLRRRV